MCFFRTAVDVDAAAECANASNYLALTNMYIYTFTYMYIFINNFNANFNRSKSWYRTMEPQTGAAKKMMVTLLGHHAHTQHGSE